MDQDGDKIIEHYLNAKEFTLSSGEFYTLQEVIKRLYDKIQLLESKEDNA